jgi:uncharacterized membrane protein YdjX (TVP38/TMEM64 family)
MTVRAMLPRLLLGLVILAGAMWLALNRDQLDPAAIEDAIHNLGLWGPVAHVVLFALGTVLFVPGTPARSISLVPATPKSRGVPT